MKCNFFWRRFLHWELKFQVRVTSTHMSIHYTELSYKQHRHRKIKSYCISNTKFRFFASCYLCGHFKKYCYYRIYKAELHFFYYNYIVLVILFSDNMHSAGYRASNFTSQRGQRYSMAYAVDGCDRCSGLSGTRVHSINGALWTPRPYLGLCDWLQV